MPKKSARRPRKAAKKQSFFQKYLTFPRLAVIVFAVLLGVFLYQVSLPGKDVKGASTTSEDSVKNSATAISYASFTPDYDHFVLTKLFLDDGDAKNKNEPCVYAKYTVKLNSKIKSVSPQCDYKWIKVTPDKNNCTKVSLTTIPTGYRLVGIASHDRVHGVQRNRHQPGVTSVSVCGDYDYGEWYGYNQVEFALQKK